MVNQRKFATVCATVLLLAGFGSTTIAQQQSTPVHASNVSETPLNSQGIQYYKTLAKKVRKGFPNSSDFQRFLSDFKSAPILSNNGDTASAWVNYLSTLQSDLNKANQSDPQIKKLQGGLSEARDGFSFKASTSPNETFNSDHLKSDLTKYGFSKLVPMVDAMEDYQNNPIAFDSAMSTTNVNPASMSEASNTNNQASIASQSASQSKSASLSASASSAQSEAMSVKASQSAKSSASVQSAKTSSATSEAIPTSASNVSSDNISSVASNVFQQTPSVASVATKTYTAKSDTNSQIPTKKSIERAPQVKKLIKKDTIKNPRAKTPKRIQKQEIKRIISRIQRGVRKMMNRYVQRHYITNKQLSKHHVNKIQLKRNCYLYHKNAKGKFVVAKRLPKGAKINIRKSVKFKHFIRLIVGHNYYMTASKRNVQLLK